MTSQLFGGGNTTPIMKRAPVTVDKTHMAGTSMSQLRDMTLLTPPYDMTALRAFSEESDVLSQCVDAMAQNIAGFGLDTEYTDAGDHDDQDPETTAIKGLLQHFSVARPASEVFTEAIRQREQCGNAYIEIIRNGKGEVVGGETLKPEYVFVTKQNEVEGLDGQLHRFRYFVYRNPLEDAANTANVWFKSFGDPTPLNMDGSMALDGYGSATEIIQLKIGDQDDPYGVPRYIGALIKIIGSRKADELNYRYFTQGKHIPLAIVVSNGHLTQESTASVQQLSNEIEAENLQHKYMVLEAVADSGDGLGLPGNALKPEVKLEHLTDTVQKDALFLDYNANVTKMVLSKFRLPPVYVGLSQDYNRATVETAKQLTEEQVFQPERKALAWRVNQLFEDYNWQHTRITFKTPDLTNAGDVAAAINAGNAVHAIAPNDVRDLLGKLLGVPMPALEGDQYDVPVGVATPETDDNADEVDDGLTDGNDGELAAELRQQLRKAAQHG